MRFQKAGAQMGYNSSSKGQRIKTCIVIVGVCLLSACSTNQGGSGFADRSAITDKGEVGFFKDASFNPQLITSVTVLPVHAGGEAQVAKSIIDRTTADLVQTINSEGRVTVLNVEKPEEVSASFAGLVSSEFAAMRNAQIVGKALAQKGLATDAVVTCKIGNFINADLAKSGNGEERVSFTLWLVDPKTERVLWSASFAARNQPASSNLLRYMSSGKWRYRSAEQMLSEGLVTVAEELSREIGPR